MCGICGIFHFDRERPVKTSVLASMNNRLFHRGPDDEGYYVSQNLGLAMRRLAIIDLATGQQPVTNEDGSLRIVYNGEIYNHEALRGQLKKKGHRFRSRSDTEAIVHLYEEHGTDCVHYLRGMFAFALWDESRRRLFVARDRLGIKPFYYRLSDREFLFGSEVKALLAHSSVRAELDRAALPEYLAYGFLGGTGTLFRGIKKLMPGHWAQIEENGRMTIEEYWDLGASREMEGRSRTDCVEAYRGALEQAVSSHLMSDVPVGVFLSGGIDSGAVAALMTKARGSPIQTFSVGYEEQAQSELGYAEIVSSHIGSIHHEVRVGKEQFFETLPGLIWHEDEPVVWPSSVSLYFVARLARQHVTVVLSGEGSDETLAGYLRYPWALWNRPLGRFYHAALPRTLRERLRQLIADSRWLSADWRRRLEHSFLVRYGEEWPNCYFEDFYAAFDERGQKELLGNDLLRAGEAPHRSLSDFWQKSDGDLLSRLLYTDIKTYLVELLMKQDNMSMAASVESRVPFLDHEVVELAMSIPSRFKTTGLDGKRILKTAVKDLLPEAILSRRKLGFPTPIRAWLSGTCLEAVEGLLSAPRALERWSYQAPAVKSLFTEHRAGHRDHTDRIWRLLNLELWCRIFLDGQPAHEVSLWDDSKVSMYASAEASR